MNLICGVIVVCATILMMAASSPTHSLAILRKYNKTGPTSSEEMVHQAALALPPSLSPLSRILNGGGGMHSSSQGQGPSSLRVKVENYKAMVGETVRFECPQPNPTWFFRRVNNDDANRSKNGVASTVEELIVTRYGIINAEYKYKIMCHSTLKHKVIIINNVEFDDEGLYTCLYTQPQNGDVLVSEAAGSNNNMAQFRYVFNLTVYTPISGLAMTIKPITMRPPGLDKLVQSKKADQQTGFEQSENSLTVRENEEFMINCVVDSSRPAADIRFNINNGNAEQPSGDPLSNGIISLLTPAPTGSLTVSSTLPPFSSSVMSSNLNFLKNIDRTFKTVQTAKLKASLDDHGKLITCKAENGFSNQKWESRKVLNVLFAPVCKDPPRTPYYIGINQTLNVECRIHNANPSKVTYEWNLDGINVGNSYSPPGPSTFNSLLSNSDVVGVNDIFIGSSNSMGANLLGSDLMLGIPRSPNSKNSDSDPYSFNYQVTSSTAASPVVKQSGFVNEGFTSRFKWRPSSIEDFGEVRCKATNEIGTTECIYELKLGGVPNPPTDCTHTLKNSSAIISCQVGFHQGDPDIYCYLLRKTDNGAYKEHTRNRESCSFIVNDVNPNKLNEFWIYSSNKHGHNKDQGVYLTIGQDIKPIEANGNKTFVMMAVIFAVTVFIILLCCFCFKLKKSMSDGDTDSVFEADAYQHKSKSSDSSLGNGKKAAGAGGSNHLNGYSSTSGGGKMLRGVKVNSYDKSFEAYETKFVKIDVNNYLSGSNPSLQMKKAMHEKLANATYVDVKREMADHRGGASRLNSDSTEKLHRPDSSAAEERKYRPSSSGHNTLTRLQHHVVDPIKYQKDGSSSDTSSTENYLKNGDRSTTNSNLSQESIANDCEQLAKPPANNKRVSNPADRFNTGAVNPNVVGVGALVRNTITSTQVKKSLSFTKSIVNSEDIDDDIEDEEEVNLNSRECTPLFNTNSNQGLLIAKDAAAKLSENSSSSISVFQNDSVAPAVSHPHHPHHHQKMVTFGANTSSPLLNNKNQRKLSTTPLSTTTTSSTLPTKASSSNSSSASPTTSSSSTAGNDLGDLDITANSPAQSSAADTNSNSISSTSSSNHNELHMLTVSDQSYKQLEMMEKHSSTLPQQQQQRPKLSTFSGVVAKKDSTLPGGKNQQRPSHPTAYRSAKRVINSDSNTTATDSQGPGYGNGARKCVRISDDLLETKYLNKLCEEIEVSLNVDCECADDYSSNDFSGDYSFDNDLKPTSLLMGGGNHVNKPQQPPPKQQSANGNFLFNADFNDNTITSYHGGSSTPKHKPAATTTNGSNPSSKAITSNISHLTDLRKNFEQNIKQLRSAANGTSGPNRNSATNNANDSTPGMPKPPNQGQLSPGKKSLGVLV